MLIKLPDPPRAPGLPLWVDESECICGARYRDFRGSGDFATAARELRQQNIGAGDPGGGFRSRRPVLTQMRADKLNEWFQEHYYCGELVREVAAELGRRVLGRSIAELRELVIPF